MTTFCTPEPIDDEYVCPVCGYGKGRGHQRPFTKQCIDTGKKKQSFPSLAGQAWNLATSLAAFAADGCRTVDRAEYERRLAICDACDKRVGNRCSQCGCSLAIKARGRAFECPLGRWGDSASTLS